MSSSVCGIDPELITEFKAFKNDRKLFNAAFIMKVDVKKLTIVKDQVLHDVTPEMLQEELPSAVPRYIGYVYKYTHKDGRESYPLCMIYYAPPQIKPNIAMMYSSSLNQLYSTLQIQKVFEVRKPHELTEEWLREKLAFFG